MKIFSRILQSIAIKVIGAYQRFLSPDHSFWAKVVHPYGYCKYHPTCSEYARQAIKKHGFVIGVFKSCCRVIRCNPFSKGGVDYP